MNTDERRAKRLAIEDGKYDVQAWNEFIKTNPQGRPEEIYEEYRQIILRKFVNETTKFI